MRALPTILAVSMLFSPAADAAVEFTPWQGRSMTALIADAASRDRMVMVVITQPDWCPPCIRLDRELLSNPDARDIAALTAGWDVLEVNGYDAEGAAFLREQALRFIGTPTTLLLQPRAGDRNLGDALQLASIVGFPDDYMPRLRSAAAGDDPLAAVEARYASTGSVDDLLEVARARADAGDAGGARTAYEEVLATPAYQAERTSDRPMTELYTAAAWETISGVTQRVAKDHERTLRELARFEQRFPGMVPAGDIAYVRGWALASLGHTDEALDVMEPAFIESGDVADLREFLYIAFRAGDEALVTRAEFEARQGLERYPGSEAALRSSHGRLLRRLGRLADAREAFARAVELTPEVDEDYVTYLGQLEFVERELAEN